jgi:stage II sporulation protein E
MHRKMYLQSNPIKIEAEDEKYTSILNKWTHPLRVGMGLFFSNAGLILFIFGLLLGRALILEELAPFAISYFAVIYHLRRDKSHFAFIGLLAGGVFSAVPHGWTICITVFIYYLLQQIFKSMDRDDITYAPFLVPVASFVGGVLYIYLFFGSFTSYQLIMKGVEAVLAMVLTFIFIQSLPVFLNRRNYQLKQEEIICLLILFASVMTGTVGWYVNDFSIENILSRYLILLLALVGGGAIGATVGVITGLILSLADIKALTQMSMLGFSGLLAGLFREGNKVGVSLGLLLGTSILTVYTGERAEMWGSTVETIISLSIFLITPKRVIEEIAKFIPGTQEHTKSQQEYVGRLRQITAERVLQFADLFRQLSKSFAQTSLSNENLEEVKTDYFLSTVTDKTCQRCWKKEQCWSRQFDFTYGNMKEMIRILEQNQSISKHQLPSDWRNACVKMDKLIAVMEEEHMRKKQVQKLNQKIKEARFLVAEQLAGISRVMMDFSKEINKETEEMGVQEKQILEALEGLGLKIQSVEIVSLAHGKVDICISHPTCSGRKECEKIIAPLISEILGENIVVSERGCLIQDGACLMRLVSGMTYDVKIGVAQAAKGGGIVSGDSYAAYNLGNGKYAVAISDGMGNGQRAYAESSATIQLLKQILQSGLDETLAIKTVNSVLNLRSTEEVFATVDLALVDLRDAVTKFLKIGSSPSFIKRGEHVRSVSASNLPIGILDDIEVDVVKEKLKPGDLLIMITDGIYEANRDVENKDLWLKRVIRDIETDDPQEVADLLLEQVIRSLHYQIHDDMTVVVAKIDHFIPKWAAIPLPNMPKIERKRIVQ